MDLQRPGDTPSPPCRPIGQNRPAARMPAIISRITRVRTSVAKSEPTCSTPTLAKMAVSAANAAARSVQNCQDARIAPFTTEPPARSSAPPAAPCPARRSASRPSRGRRCRQQDPLCYPPRWLLPPPFPMSPSGAGRTNRNVPTKACGMKRSRSLAHRFVRCLPSPQPLTATVALSRCRRQAAPDPDRGSRCGSTKAHAALSRSIGDTLRSIMNRQLA